MKRLKNFQDDLLYIKMGIKRISREKRRNKNRRRKFDVARCCTACFPFVRDRNYTCIKYNGKVEGGEGLKG